jgi:hypothetical protein
VTTDWTVAGVGDFNADMKDDILWRNDDGQIAMWLMNGIALAPGGGFAGNGSAPTDWTVAGNGDFNGDMKDDVLWRNDNGQIAMWLLSGTNLVGGGFAGPGSATTDWVVA